MIGAFKEHSIFVLKITTPIKGLPGDVFVFYEEFEYEIKEEKEGKSIADGGKHDNDESASGEHHSIDRQEHNDHKVVKQEDGNSGSDSDHGSIDRSEHDETIHEVVEQEGGKLRSDSGEVRKEELNVAHEELEIKPEVPRAKGEGESSEHSSSSSEHDPEHFHGKRL